MRFPTAALIRSLVSAEACARSTQAATNPRVVLLHLFALGNSGTEVIDRNAAEEASQERLASLQMFRTTTAEPVQSLCVQQLW